LHVTIARWVLGLVKVDLSHLLAKNAAFHLNAALPGAIVLESKHSL